LAVVLAKAALVFLAARVALVVRAAGALAVVVAQAQVVPELRAKALTAATVLHKRQVAVAVRVQQQQTRRHRIQRRVAWAYLTALVGLLFFMLVVVVAVR
jgi:hypothetical protein